MISRRWGREEEEEQGVKGEENEGVEERVRGGWG